MGRSGNRLNISVILVAVASMAFLTGSAGFGMEFQEETDQTTQPPPPRRGDQLGQDGAKGDESKGGRRFNRGGRRFGRASSRRFPVGTYDLEIEVKAATDSEPVQVLVNGKRVAANEAAFLMGFILRQKDSGRERVEESVGPPLTIEQIDNVMTVVKDFDALLYSDLLALQQKSDPRFLLKVRRLTFEYAGDINLKDRDEEAYQLKVDDRLLEMQLRELQFEVGMTQPTEPAAIADYQDQVRELLEQRFEIQHKLRGRDIGRMQTRLSWVEKEWVKRLERMEEIVDAQLSSIFDELLIGSR